jgi:hypothetical protein
MKPPVLLERRKFSEAVQVRDGLRCVFCKRTAEETPEGKLDSHHIIERRLFAAPHEFGGYFIENGATVCEEHHLQCEQTVISVEEVRVACGITRIIVPSHLYDDQQIDKWGNPILANGTRIRGELFFDESVQKVLKQGGVLDLFTHHVKYPRTYHMPWSQNIHDDDRIIPSMSAFEGQRVILTRKMDGECTTMYQDHFHARSLDSPNHSSRNWVKNFWGQIQGDIPEFWRVCGENLYAEHSIAYDDLPSYFMGFSMWNERNVCLSWDETMEWFSLLGITPVQVVFDGIYDEKAIRAICEGMDWQTDEGFVLRLADSFSYGEFRHKAAKFVRKDHVQTVKHWMHGREIIPNKLAAQ